MHDNANMGIFMLGIIVIAFALSFIWFPLGLLFAGAFLAFCGGVAVNEDRKRKPKDDNPGD